MLPVSSNDKNKAQLLRERQDKLAKWKQKKARFDQQKKTAQTQQDTNNETNESKIAARRSKLEAWKKRKREGDQERLQGKAVDVDTNKRKKKQKKSSKERIAFDLSDEESDNTTVQLFRPTQNSFPQNELNGEAKKSPETTSSIDPLEAYMQSLSTAKDNSKSSAGELLEPKDDDLMMSSDDDNLNGVDGDARYTRMAKLKLKKKVKEVTYSTEDLEPFRKEFYSQSEELNSVSESEAQELRLAMGNIKIRGEGCPLPVTRWSQLGLTTDIMNFIIYDLKFELPTPIQAQAIPAIMSGRDVIGISKTGSGKTISYLLPLIRQIKAQRPLSLGETGPLGLILAPTRELALQIHEEVNIFTRNDTSINSIGCTGGSELKGQINKLKRGTEIVVATPGRFIDLLTLNTGKLLTTKRITFVVLDEADRLFDLGFEPQINQIMKTVRPDKQCVLFSATFPNKLRSFATHVLSSPLTITINSKSLVNENVKQKFAIFKTDEEKFAALLSILDKRMQEKHEQDGTKDLDEAEGDDKIIIFVSSQQICDLLDKRLENEGYNVFSIHAGKPYSERINNLQRFKTTRNGMLLCTEVLSRGLNVPEVSLVIIYNAVKTFAQYVHTTGRTARGMHSGDAITLLLDTEINSAYILRKAMRDEELSDHDSSMVKTLTDMSNKFESGIKDGKFKISQGFGGKGLDNLESKRETKQKEERKCFEKEQDTGENRNYKSSNRDEQVSSDASSQIQVPKLQYSISQILNPDGIKTFSAEVNVNDLPQVIRWEATKNSTLMFIKHETGCSITNKGKFYPTGKEPQSAVDEPKLYLLIESQNDKDIRLSIELLEQKVKEGVRKAGTQSIRDTKY